MSGCEQHHHCSVRSCTPTVQQLAPSDSQQSGSEITQAVGRSQKKGDPLAGRVLYATAHIFSSPLAPDILSFCRQRSPVNSVDVTFKTGKERRDQHQETRRRTVQESCKARTIDYQLMETSCSGRRALVQTCVRSSCTAYAGGCGLHVHYICVQPFDKGSCGPCAPCLPIPPTACSEPVPVEYR